RNGCNGFAGINYQLVLNTSSGEGLAFGSGFAGEVTTGRDLPLNTWTHLTGMFDGSTYRLYINGELAGSAAGSPLPPDNAPLMIGGSGDCSTFAGLIDEVRIYNRALSQAEIQAIASTGPVSGLVSAWQAEGNAADAVDGNTGTLQNGATFAPGRVGQAF